MFSKELVFCVILWRRHYAFLSLIIFCGHGCCCSSGFSPQNENYAQKILHKNDFWTEVLTKLLLIKNNSTSFRSLVFFSGSSYAYYTEHIPILFLIGTWIVFTLDALQSFPVGWPQFGAFIWFYRSCIRFIATVLWDDLGGVGVQIVITFAIGLCLVCCNSSCF